ncbi:DUF1990 family protein [Aporhodopirellula aestuarii]|uniref:DUF1990 domain-containing protein n=1 Tax=Aporhodopirellula aestuarii TaxID=2950107 RepID=A0ABT0TXC2_9BACT|nr:DUF1990 domain-containing protein [Aporhodopirellula aestuarii]MCM2369252.1 DUF1990 domain-containing protein [Aporhodopirellula aestuarii]
MFSISKPNDLAIDRFLKRQARCDFNYPDVGASAGELPPGYDHHHVDVELGRGDLVFAKAQSAITSWAQFRVGWVEACPPTTPLVIGQNIAIRARFFGLYALAACRIVDAFGCDEGSGRNFGVSIGTLPDHPEQGEERFEISQSRDGDVRYQVTAFFRANQTLATLAWPYLRYRFNKFRDESADTMRAGVAIPR